MMKYPVLTIRQFYAALGAIGIKDVENRSKPFPVKMLGKTILIHAGFQWHDHYKGRKAHLKKFQDMIIHAALRSHYTAAEVLDMINDAPQVAERGGIIGAMRITASVQNSKSPWAMPDHHHWLSEDARPVPWHPCRGKLGIWYLDYPHEVPEVPKSEAACRIKYPTCTVKRSEIKE